MTGFIGGLPTSFSCWIFKDAEGPNDYSRWDPISIQNAELMTPLQLMDAIFDEVVRRNCAGIFSARLSWGSQHNLNGVGRSFVLKYQPVFQQDCEIYLAQIDEKIRLRSGSGL